MLNNYIEQISFLSNNYDEVDGYSFYQYIFPNNENKGEFCTDFSKPNAIYLYQDEKDQGTKRRLRRRIMLNDTWEDDYMEFVEGNLNTLCSGLSYRGKVNKIDKAQKMNALVFDLDGVGRKEIRNLFYRFGEDPSKFRTLPMPTFLVSSGTGVHVYYVFKTPIDLFPNIKLQLKALKYELTFRMWDYKTTSQNKAIQYQSINQGFRMVGSVNDKYGIALKAFQTGERVTLDYINQYAREPFRVHLDKPFRSSTIMTRLQAKENYPEWYQRVVVEKNKRQKKWDIKSKQGYALYEWWKKKVYEVRGGHRYFFLMCMAIYACKCDVPQKQLKKDMYEVFDYLKSIHHENELTEWDVRSALEAYDKAYYNFTIADIEKLTDVRIDRNRRNGRKQKDHIRTVNAIRKFRRDELGENEYKNSGRPQGSGTKKDLVMQWKKNNPEGKKADCIRDTGLSKPTVYKWWNDENIQTDS